MKINLNNCTFLHYEQLYILLSENVVFIKCIMFANSSVVSFLLILLWGLMSLHRSSSCRFNCPNVLAFSGCHWWTYSRLIFSNCSPQNVSYWMRRASDTDAIHNFCNAQRVEISTYKNAHTLTTMIGITPRGQVSCVSGAFGESASDRHTIERPTLLTDGRIMYVCPLC